ncbi:MAG: esterase-like activity of phytase family protein [Gaiellaceae bacterium]
MALGSRLRGRLAIALAVVLTANAVAASSAAAAPDRAKTPALEFLGEEIVPTGTMFAGTQVGGLSSIAYDQERDAFYVLSDDPSQFQPARFYTIQVDVADGTLDDGDVDFLDVTTITGPDGQPFAPLSLDPEGLALTKDDELVITSEGFSNRLVDPWIRLFDLDGGQIGELPLPDAFRPNAAGTRGVRLNLGFESAATPPNGRFLFSGTEGALVQDGPAASLTAASPARLVRYNLQIRRLDRQYVYLTDRIAEPPVPPTSFAVNGLVELLPLNNQFLLSMERSFSVGAPGTGNTIKLYNVALPGATNVNGLQSLSGSLERVRPARKTLLLDLDALGIPLDNVEGMAFGPDLPDGRRSLLLVSDNNFSPLQFTQFLLFAVSRS